MLHDILDLSINANLKAVKRLFQILLIVSCSSILSAQYELSDYYGDWTFSRYIDGCGNDSYNFVTTTLTISPYNQDSIALIIDYEGYGVFDTISAAVESSISDAIYIEGFLPDLICLDSLILSTYDTLVMNSNCSCLACTCSGDYMFSRGVSSNKEHLELNAHIQLSPNPVKNILHVNVELQGYDGYKMSIYDSQGKILQCLDLDTNTIDIDVSSFSPGLYFVRINQGEMISVRRFVKL